MRQFLYQAKYYIFYIKNIEINTYLKYIIIILILLSRIKDRFYLL